MNYSTCKSGVLRPYLNRDKEAVFRLLSVLPRMYPRGFEWLDRRLRDVLDRRARCTLAISNSDLAGLTIETPKGPHIMKLSTIWVAPGCRHTGFGSSLLVTCCRRWHQSGIRFVYVTADSKIVWMLWPLLRGSGFRFLNTQVNRYGEGRDESVFGWGSG